MGTIDDDESLESILADVCRSHYARVHPRLEALGLYRGQSSVLRALWEHEGVTQTELAQRLRIRPATVTKTLQRMEKTGFLERRSDSRDQRVSRVYLTRAGRAIRDKVLAVRRAMEKEVFSGFTLEERVLLRRFFVQIRENIRRAEENAPAPLHATRRAHAAETISRLTKNA